MKKLKRFLIVDEFPITRAGIIYTLKNKFKNMDVCEYEKPEKVYQLAVSFEPDVIIMELLFNGIFRTDIIDEFETKTRSNIIIYSQNRDLNIIIDVIRKGVSGYIHKQSERIQLEMGVEEAMLGNRFCDSIVIKSLLESLARKCSKDLPLRVLTKRERQVFDLISKKIQLKEISKLLFISHKTVENHLSNICRKLGIKGKHEIYEIAV